MWRKLAVSKNPNILYSQKDLLPLTTKSACSKFILRANLSVLGGFKWLWIFLFLPFNAYYADREEDLAHEHVWLLLCLKQLLPLHWVNLQVNIVIGKDFIKARQNKHPCQPRHSVHGRTLYLFSFSIPVTSSNSSAFCFTSTPPRLASLSIPVNFSFSFFFPGLLLLIGWWVTAGLG